MQHATTDADKVLKQRGKIYGSYSVGVKERTAILEALNGVHKDKFGKDMPSGLRTMFGDLALKLMRAAADPTHIDSWVDLEGYAKLIKEYHVGRYGDKDESK